MPRASKAVDAAKQLGRKVADAAAAKTAAAAAAKAGTPRKSAAKPAAVSKPAKAEKAVKAKAAPPVAKGKPEKTTRTKKAPVAVPAAAPKVEQASKPAKAAKAPKAAKSAESAGDRKFLDEQRELLAEERINYVAQAEDLKAEADQLAQEMEPGDIQFDDESGEGATAAVDRERDLALSAQARVEVDEIDHALAKLDAGTYGMCEGCGQPIPRARLRALPHARLCVACKSGGLSRR